MLKINYKFKFWNYRWFILLPAICYLLSVGFTGCTPKHKKKIGETVKPAEPVPSTAEEPSLRGKEYKEVGELQNVYFDYDVAILRADARTVLSRNAEWLKSNPDVEIIIEGHCDERGTTDYNIALGDRRAKAVRKYLMKLGIEGNRMATITYGEEKPVAFGHDERSWSKNRRANMLGRIPPEEQEEDKE
ncbi:MAG: peptidoglycan-associated lipoprotein Pal [Elusimicrobia bacterium]|nr:peptidoglycan-associated lipoprotein Pal [Elusimicrobiota bacterium]